MEHLRIPDNKLLQTMLLYAEKSIPQIAKPLTQKLKKKKQMNLNLQKNVGKVILKKE